MEADGTMGKRVPVLKVKISVGPFANGQTRTIEYAENLPFLLLNNKNELIRQFAALYERLEATIDEMTLNAAEAEANDADAIEGGT